MTLTAADVAEIMRLVEQSSFDELSLEMDGTKLSLRRESAGPRLRPAPQFAVEMPDRAGASAPVAVAPAAGSAPAAQSSPAVINDPAVHAVASPLLGTFYRSPKPGAPPFVEVGAVVEENTIVAIIEVMKLMNTVRAGVRGTVTEILVTDGELAEYGQALLRVRRQD
jgi:acetyl-CoA carboxylase biotin carboxyl carrier protein